MATKLERDIRDANRLLQPGPVALITSRFKSADNVMTAAWMMPVSLDPPLLAVAIHPGRLTHEYVSKSEFFALNIPTADLLGAVHSCGMLTGREGDKFEAAGLTPVDATQLELPLIDECVAHIECGVVSRTALGDHDLFIAQPLAVVALDEAFNERWLVESDAGQIVHHLRADYYATLSRPYQAKLDDEDE
ncbi:MAG TPA: flavin reductase family protein [Thermomicrobiales bacterium]|nr:flavin reductase family protein [Thermomicrobiales bacterium]